MTGQTRRNLFAAAALTGAISPGWPAPHVVLWRGIIVALAMGWFILVAIVTAAWLLPLDHLRPIPGMPT